MGRSIMNTRLGCIADDFTGATDLAGLLARSEAANRIASEDRRPFWPTMAMLKGAGAGAALRGMIRSWCSARVCGQYRHAAPSAKGAKPGRARTPPREGARQP